MGCEVMAVDRGKEPRTRELSAERGNGGDDYETQGQASGL